MNVMDEDKIVSERDEDRETNDPAAVSAGYHGIFLFSVHMNSSVVTNTSLSKKIVVLIIVCFMLCTCNMKH